MRSLAIRENRAAAGRADNDVVRSTHMPARTKCRKRARKGRWVEIKGERERERGEGEGKESKSPPGCWVPGELVLQYLPSRRPPLWNIVHALYVPTHAGLAYNYISHSPTIDYSFFSAPSARGSVHIRSPSRGPALGPIEFLRSAPVTTAIFLPYYRAPPLAAKTILSRSPVGGGGKTMGF